MTNSYNIYIHQSYNGTYEGYIGVEGYGWELYIDDPSNEGLLLMLGVAKFDAIDSLLTYYMNDNNCRVLLRMPKGVYLHITPDIMHMLSTKIE